MSLISLLLSYRFLLRDEWTENENGFISTTVITKQEFKCLNGERTQTRRRPFYTPKPDADLCMRVDLPLDKKLWKDLPLDKKLWKIDRAEKRLRMSSIRAGKS